MVNSQVESENFEYQVKSLEGRIIKKNKTKLNIGTNEYIIESSNLVSGIYFININLDGQNVKTSKLIIAR